MKLQQNKSSVKSVALQALWTAKLTVWSLMLSLCPVMGLKNSRTEVWLMMTRLDTLLKLKVMQKQRDKLPSAG